MSIWRDWPDLEQLNERIKHTASGNLGVRYDSVDGDSITASMPIEHRSLQAIGLYCVAEGIIAESVGSVASVLCVDMRKHNCVGIEINISRLHRVESGRITAVAKPLSIGEAMHTWEIRITDSDDRLCAVARLTVMIFKKDIP